MEKTDYKITEFHNSEFGSIRMIEDGGRLLFSGIDVAFALGYAKPRNAINVHCKGALKRGVLTSGGGIGRHAIVGAGSVVTKDVPDYAVAVGNPAKVIKMLDKEKFQED